MLRTLSTGETAGNGPIDQQQELERLLSTVAKLSPCYDHPCAGSIHFTSLHTVKVYL